MAKADEEEALQAARACRAKVREQRDEIAALTKLNRKLGRDLKRVNEEPNVVQLAITGTAVAAGVAGGIAGHRYLRKKTEKWVQKDDPKKRTLGAVMVCEILPITGGLLVGGLTAMSDSGVVASIGGLGWGEAAGVVIDLILPEKKA